MTSDRSIHLDASVPRFGTGAADARTPGHQQQPDARDSDRFTQAMAEGTPGESAGQAAPGAGLPAPMSLFGSQRPVASMSPDLPRSTLADSVGEALSRMMVGEGRSGGRQVRMELKDELLPGVTVSIEEVEGRLQVDFLCRNEDSRRRLVAAAPREAPELAHRLRREVLLRVQADDPDDPQLFEVGGAP